jgi:hypothetical protein
VSDDIPLNKKNNDDQSEQSSTPLLRDRMSIAREIEENLKRVYQASLTEAVPDRFTQLLAQLREKEGKS